MADWTPPPWAQLVAGKAWTDEKAAAAFENLLAALEGAPNTPRIQPPSMAQPLVSASGQVAIASANWLAFTGLDEVKDLRVDFHITNANASPQATAFEVAFSADGGSTWGSSQSILTTSDINNASMALGFARIDMESGDLRGSCYRANTSATSTLVALSSTLTVPADCNAIRFRLSSGASRGFGVSIMSLGGRA